MQAEISKRPLSFERLSLLLCVGVVACGGAPPGAQRSARPARVLDVSELEWEALNPARGDQSPRAANLWGDRTAEDAAGFLVRFVDGFSSPPHIHNVSYRAVVIEGLVHNAHASAPPMWMPPGSFWTQPRGAPHITSSRGVSVAYVEVDRGPYLVRPTDQAFETAERPVNVDASNVVWLDGARLGWGEGTELAYVWGRPGHGPHGALMRMRGGAATTLAPSGEPVRAVVVSSRVQHDGRAHAAGSYLGGAAMRVTCAGPACVLYLRFGR